MFKIMDNGNLLMKKNNRLYCANKITTVLIKNKQRFCSNFHSRGAFNGFKSFCSFFFWFFNLQFLPFLWMYNFLFNKTKDILMIHIIRKIFPPDFLFSLFFSFLKIMCLHIYQYILYVQ